MYSKQNHLSRIVAKNEVEPKLSLSLSLMYRKYSSEKNKLKQIMKQISKSQMGRVTKNDQGVIHNYTETKDVNWDRSTQNWRNGHYKNLVHLGGFANCNDLAQFCSPISFSGLQSTFKSVSPESGQDINPMFAESAVDTEQTCPLAPWRLGALALLRLPGRGNLRPVCWRGGYIVKCSLRGPLPSF